MLSRNPDGRAANTEPASVALLEAALAAILRAIGEVPAALSELEERSAARPAPGILIDYITPQELAAELHIKESHLAIWKREGFGPPRTRIRHLVVYRREAVLRWLLGLEEGHQGVIAEQARDDRITPAWDARPEERPRRRGKCS